jgi:hypothetical protein
MLHALCSSPEVLMPAIASLEDLRAAQKDGVSIYAMLHALCSMLQGDGGALVGRICVSYGSRNGLRSN